MSIPSPFELSQQIGKNLGQTAQDKGETFFIEDVLSKASQSNPEQIDDFIGQIITKVSPRNQEAAYKLLQEKKNSIIGKRQQETYSRLADNVLEANPDSPMHKNFADILRSNLPFKEKEGLLKSVYSNLPGQQKRLLDESVRKRYEGAIKEKTEEFNSAIYPEDKEKIREEKRALQRERNQMLGIGIGAKRKGFEEEEEVKETFDLQNPEHYKILEKLDKKFKGNKEKIKAKLSEQFTFGT